MMRETQRLAYLNALGITQFVPLAPIPGAPLLPALQEAEYTPDMDEADAVSVTADPLPGGATTSSADVESSSQPMAAQEPPVSAQPPAAADIPVLDMSKVKPEPAAKAAPARPAVITLRFALAVVTLPQRLRLIVELAQPDAPGFSAREHRLVSDLLLALHPRFELHDSATTLFRWPLVNNPRIAADASAARDALFAFLAGAEETAVVPATVFLGSTAAGCLQAAEPGIPFQLADISGRCLVTHSLRELEQDWRLKPVAWGHLLALLPPSLA